MPPSDGSHREARGIAGSTSSTVRPKFSDRLFRVRVVPIHRRDPCPAPRTQFDSDPFRVRWYRFSRTGKCVSRAEDAVRPIPSGFAGTDSSTGTPRERARFRPSRSDGRIGHGVLSGTQTLLTAFLSVMLVVAVISVVRARGRDPTSLNEGRLYGTYGCPSRHRRTSGTRNFGSGMGVQG